MNALTPVMMPYMDIKRNEVINLLLLSVAMEELALAQILNKEGEKIQAALDLHPSIEELLLINKSVNRTLGNVIKKEMLLLFKIQYAIELECPKPCSDEE